MSLAQELIAKELFGNFVRLKHKVTGEEVLILKSHWWSIKDGSPHLGGKLLETDAVIPEAVHLYEASRALHQMSTKRIIDAVGGDRQWIEVEEANE